MPISSENREVAFTVNDIHIKFENRAQLRDFRDYYTNCTEGFRHVYKPFERVIIGLCMLGWGRYKIVEKTRGYITVRQVNRLYKENPCILRLRLIVKKAANKNKNPLDYYTSLNDEKIGSTD